MKLQGKVALITGASRGIGRGIAEVFAQEGADVAVNYEVQADKAEEVAAWIREQGRRAIAVKADVASVREVEAMVERVWSELGPIDALVNNAGIETIIPFLEMTEEQWQRLTEVNLKGEFFCCQAVAKRMVASGTKGTIINIGSVQAGAYLPGRTHYAPAKLGIEALTRNMSVELGEHGIRVNCIHPGLFETDMTAWVLKRPDLLPGVLAKLSLGRAADPREMGTVAAFLSCDESSYITGQSIYVDGGWAGK